MTELIKLTADRSGLRVDRFAAKSRPQLSRSQIQKLIAAGLVTVNDEPVRASHKLRRGDRVTIIVPPPARATLEAEDIPLTVVYEDADLLVIDKPPGLTVHPGPGHPSQTLVNALLARCPDIAKIDDTQRPGIVHRLDKDTSGLIMVARHKAAQGELGRQLKEGAVLKGYLALVRGCPSPEEGVIEAPIGRHPVNRKKMAVVPHGRPARTRYRVLERLGEGAKGRERGFSLLEATPETGRTHQIRVHLAHIGHPVVGDGLYGPRSPYLARQFLHAHRLGFRLPPSGEWVEFGSELPPDLRWALEQLDN